MFLALSEHRGEGPDMAGEGFEFRAVGQDFLQPDVFGVGGASGRLKIHRVTERGAGGWAVTGRREGLAGCTSIASTGGPRTDHAGSPPGRSPAWSQESGYASVWSLHAAPEHPFGRGGKRCPFTSVLQWWPAPQSHA